MWGQGLVQIDDDINEPPPPEGGTHAVVVNPGGVAPASGTENSINPDSLENGLEKSMNMVLGGVTDAFAINLPFTTEDKKRIVKNLNNISEEYEDEDLKFTRAALFYMLKELRDVFGNQDAVDKAIDAAAIEEAAIEERNAAGLNKISEEGIETRKRQRERA